jgi:hypothetical protein
MKAHTCSFERNKGDDDEDGNEHFSPSSIEDNLAEDNLGDALDRLLNSSSSASPLNGTTPGFKREEPHLSILGDGGGCLLVVPPDYPLGGGLAGIHPLPLLHPFRCRISPVNS